MDFFRLSLELIVLLFLTLLFDTGYLYLNKNFFTNMVYDIQDSAMTIRWSPVIICYAFIVLGIYYFIIREKKSIYEAFLLGLVIYVVYDSTNYATLTNYSLSFAIMDTLWGGILFALVTYCYQLLIKYI
jgi:uncharacterized membrane protein